MAFGLPRGVEEKRRAMDGFIDRFYPGRTLDEVLSDAFRLTYPPDG